MPDNSKFYVPVLSFLTLAGVVLLIRFWPEAWPGIPSNIGGYFCGKGRCTLQDWLSATAGWAGFAAAVVGAYFIYHQLAEQRKQTAFMIGDGAASIEVNEFSMNKTRTVFRIINWNRRPYSVERITLQCAAVKIPNPSHLRFFTPNFDHHTSSDDVSIRDNGYLRQVPAISGWLDRQAGPEVMDFQLHFHEGEEDFTDLLEGVDSSVKATILIDGVFEDGAVSRQLLTINVEALNFLPNTCPRKEYDSK